MKDAIKAYEQTTSLPYDEVPTEICHPISGTRTLDLSEWSILVNDASVKKIATIDRDRIHRLAVASSISQVR